MFKQQAAPHFAAAVNRQPAGKRYNVPRALAPQGPSIIDLP